MINHDATNPYQVGGSLAIDSPSYVKRQADEQLYQAAQQGEFCYVFNAQQMGKSSLRVQVMHRLRDMGFQLGLLDMTTIVSLQITPDQWYASLLHEIVSSFQLKVNLRLWWQSHAHLQPIQRIANFLEEILLTEVQQRIIIFIDEIDTVLKLSFPVDDFFALIRKYHNQTGSTPRTRLSFILLGVTIPSALTTTESLTLFRLGQAVALQGFQFSESLPLLSGLQKKVKNAEAILRRTLTWTNGQPFLTQKICQWVFELSQDVPQSVLQCYEWVDDLVRSRMIDSWEYQDDPEHLNQIAKRLIQDRQQVHRLLGLYQQVLTSELSPAVSAIAANQSPEQVELFLSGLVIEEEGYLRVHNRIYQQVFSLKWVEHQLASYHRYESQLAAWICSGLAQSCLLQGAALYEAQIWAREKRLNKLDHRFLAASSALEQLRKQFTYQE